MALPPFPTVGNGRLLAPTNEAWDQFYVDYANGTDGAGVAGTRLAPWKTLDVAFNSRLGAGGSHDHNGQPCILNVRNTSVQYNDVAAGTNKSLGLSNTTTQNRGGSLSEPWVIRTDPEDAENAAQDSADQAHVHIHLTFNSSMYYVRFERLRLGGPNVTAFDNPQGAGCRFVQLFYCSMYDMAQNGPQWIGNSLQIPTNCGTWGCSIHDGGDDTTGTPHDHGIYAGSGAVTGADDCFSVNDLIYRMTGYGIQWYEQPNRFLIANTTIDECSYPASVTERGGLEIGGESGSYARECLIVNSIISTIPNTGSNKYAIHANHPGSPPASGLNEAHHNGYFVDCPNEDTRWTNCVTYGGNNVDSDPLYVDRANRDYHLEASSPMKDMADPDYMPPTDFDGNPFVTNDIGAFAVPATGVPRHWEWRF